MYRATKAVSFYYPGELPCVMQHTKVPVCLCRYTDNDDLSVILCNQRYYFSIIIIVSVIILPSLGTEYIYCAGYLLHLSGAMHLCVMCSHMLGSFSEHGDSMLTIKETRTQIKIVF